MTISLSGGPVDFRRVLEEVVGFVRGEGYAIAVAGGFGLHAYGMSRATYDLDFVVEAEAQEKLVRFMESMGYETWHRSEGYSNHLHSSPELGRVDFVYVRAESSRKLFGQVREMIVFEDVSVAVPRAEHLIAMKVQAMKNDPARVFQEMADIQYLLGLEGIDEDEVRAYFERAGLLERFDEIRKRS